MTNLIYWYGCSGDLANAYSFEKSSKLMTYENGLNKIEKKLNGLRKKQGEGKTLLKLEANLLKGMEEITREQMLPTRHCMDIVPSFTAPSPPPTSYHLPASRL